MNLLEIIVDKDKNLKVKNSSDATVGDLMGLVGSLLAEIANQTKKPINAIYKDLKRLMKVSKVWK